MTRYRSDHPHSSSFTSRAIHELHPNRLLPSLTAGFVSGVFEIVIAVSFAALLFGGDLSGYLANGIGLALFGTIIIGLVIALTTSLPGVVAGNQDVPAAIMAVVVATVATSLAAWATSQEIYITVVATIAITTIATGLCLWGLGIFKLGGLVRFLPYPVIGGFLAGSGWLLVTGAIGFMADTSSSLAALPQLMQMEMIGRWLPGLILSLAIFVIFSRFNHYLVFPAIVIGSSILFFIILFLSGFSFAEASAQGWLLGPFPDERLWQPLSVSDLSLIQWPAIWTQIPTIVSIIFVSAVALLLNATSLELEVREDMDMNRELRSAGIANVLAGFGTGIIGYHFLGGSALNFQMKATSRLVGVISSVIVAASLFLGATPLSLMPKIVVGALLLYLGITFLYEWIYKAWFKLSKVDYAVVILILVVIVGVGFLQGVAVGIVATVLVFIVNYSRIDIVKGAFTGSNFRSRVTRSREQQQICLQNGDQVYILQLHGYMFFGTANSLLERVRSRILREDLSPVRFIVLDFREITGIDSTAMLSFARMKQLAEQYDVYLVLAHLSPEIQHQLELGDFLSGEDNSVSILRDLDYALEWCETQLLLEADADKASHAPNLLLQLENMMPEKSEIKTMLTYFKKECIDANQYLIKQGASPDDMYFIESGQITVQLEQEGKEAVRLQSLQGGTIIGEIGFYLGVNRTASVIADEPSTIYRITTEDLARMEREDPEAASTLHRLIVHLLSERVSQLVRTVNALEQR